MNSFFLTDNFSGDIMADYPFLGALYHKDKTVFRVQSEHAAGMELCLFSPDEKEEIRIKVFAAGKKILPKKLAIAVKNRLRKIWIPRVWRI